MIGGDDLVNHLIQRAQPQGSLHHLLTPSSLTQWNLTSVYLSVAGLKNACRVWLSVPFRRYSRTPFMAPFLKGWPVWGVHLRQRGCCWILFNYSMALSEWAITHHIWSCGRQTGILRHIPISTGYKCAHTVLLSCQRDAEMVAQDCEPAAVCRAFQGNCGLLSTPLQNKTTTSDYQVCRRS